MSPDSTSFDFITLLLLMLVELSSFHLFNLAFKFVIKKLSIQINYHFTIMNCCYQHKIIETQKLPNVDLLPRVYFFIIFHLTGFIMSLLVHFILFRPSILLVCDYDYSLIYDKQMVNGWTCTKCIKHISSVYHPCVYQGWMQSQRGCG